MRLFVSVDLPEEIFHFLRDVQALISHEGLAMAQHFHLTLFFMGEVTEEMMEKVKGELKGLDTEEFVLTMNELGFFPDKDGEPRVIWVGVEENEVLKKLQKQVAERMNDVGFEEELDFVPHITLARVKEGGDGVKKDLENICFKQRSFRVESFSLMESELMDTGAYYTSLEEYRLKR